MTLGIIGFPLSHSFSKKYFEEKFSQLGLLDWRYELLPIEDINLLMHVIGQHEDLVGFNVTIPHKTNVVPYCSELSEEAATIGAVNCIWIDRRGGKIELKGYNTDAFGFEKSLTGWYKPGLNKAIIYGDGGAAKAVKYALEKTGITYIQVVRNKRAENQFDYHQMNHELFSGYDLIVNCTPVGMFPKNNEQLEIESSWITPGHQYFDLVYNPVETATMKLFADRGARAKNGLEMLHLQADKAWKIWQGNP